MRVKETGREEKNSSVYVVIKCFAENGEEMGWLMYREPDPAAGGVLHIELIVTSPRYRRRGVGSALISHLKELSRTVHNRADICVYISSLEAAQGHTRLSCLTSFYQKNDFTVEKISRSEAMGRFKF